MADSDSVKITEIFLSLQGESRSVGFPTVFVRLTGCPLRCRWCDTEYAFSGGERRRLDDIVERVLGFGVRHVTVTGGEPLAQPNCLTLLSRLCDHGLEVSLETSGAFDVRAVDSRVIKVLDLKAPGSGEMAKNRLENLDVMSPQDQLKVVLSDRADYLWARDWLRGQPAVPVYEVLFSPVFGELTPRQLADWIVEDALPVRFQLQLHKQLWGDEPGR